MAKKCEKSMSGKHNWERQDRIFVRKRGIIKFFPLKCQYCEAYDDIKKKS